ncbi:MAG: DUF3611 family protein [Synechococcus sp.]
MTIPAPGELEPMLVRQHYASSLRIVGWIGFWSQLILGMTAGAILLFSYGREIQNHPGTQSGLFLLFASGVALAGGTLAKIINIQVGRQLRKPDRRHWPSRHSVMRLCDFEAFLHWAGMIVVLIGTVLIVSNLTSIAMSLVPGIISDASKTIQPLDLLVIQASTALMAGHFVGISTSFWNLRGLLLLLSQRHPRPKHRPAKALKPPSSPPPRALKS